MQVFRQEFRAILLRAFIDAASQLSSVEAVDRVLSEFGTSRRELRDPNAWVSLEFVEACLRRMTDLVQDPAFFDIAGRATFSPAYMGWFARPALRTVASPATTYQHAARLLPRVNKIGRIEVAMLGRTRVRLRYSPLPGSPRETDNLVCRGRISQFAWLPTVFELPPAKVEHPECMLRGQEACIYEVELVGERRRWVSVFGAVGGAAASLAVSIAANLPIELSTWVVSSTTALLWGIGRVYELKSDVADRMRDLSDATDSLTRSVIANEERYAELLEAKSEVDKKVEQRTAELRATSQKLSEALEEVQALAQAKTDFFANVSHELRTPLTLILGPLDDMVLGNEPPGGTIAALESMRRNAGRLLRLINQLLDLSKVDAGAMTLAKVPCDPKALATSVAASFETAAQMRAAHVGVQSSEQVASIALDTSWIESALTNLIGNALRFVDAGGHVVVRVTDVGSEVVLEVEDDGPGIPADDLPRVFDRFAQAGNQKARKGGTGLGLAIVREAARLHGGDASVESRPGRTVFTLRLPRLLESTEPEPNTGEQTIPKPSEPRRRAISSIPPPNENPEVVRFAGPSDDAPLALVVEDNDDLRAFVANVLVAHYNVVTAPNGEEGLRLAIEARPDIVVSDVAMPLMDGIAMCRALRQHEETKATPVLLLTAHGRVNVVLDAFEAGADDYLTKPFHGRELLARVSVHVRLRRMVWQAAHRERLASVGVLAATVAHEARNGLTSLMGGLPAMRRKLGEKLDPSTKELLDVMIASAQRIERLTTDLLDLSRVDRVSFGPYRPGAGLMASLRLMSAKLSHKVILTSNVDERAIVIGRAGDMNHVFMNLIDNAGKAVGDAGEIRVEGRTEGGEYVVEVQDSGKGIEPQLAARIFEPFVTTRPAGEGTGLGLAIAKQVVEQHGGTISVDRSTLGGARFVLRLPVGEPDRVVVQ